MLDWIVELINIDIIINIIRYKFECVKTYCLFIYKLKEIMNNSKHSIEKNRYNQNL